MGLSPWVRQKPLLVLANLRFSVKAEVPKMEIP